MGQFVSQSKHLRGCYGPSKDKYHFFDTFTKDSSALITDVLHQEYVTSELFTGPLSVKFTDVQKVTE